MAMVGSITRGEVMGTPGTQIEWVTESTDKSSSDTTSIDQSAEGPNDYSDIIKDSAFIGDTPLESILEGLDEQFNDYINIDDKTNYVDVFYTQLHNSYEAVNSNEEELHPNEIIETIDEIHQTFINKLAELFKNRLTLSFGDLEGEAIDYDDMEFVFRRMYEFFILGARNNFKTVIAADIVQKVAGIADDREYFNKVEELVMSHNPLITSFGPMEFLRYRNDTEIIEMFDNGKVIGNFLRKYTPKFYQNEEYRVEVINHITMIQQFKTDLVESTGEFMKSNLSQETKLVVEKTIDDYRKMIRSSEDDSESEQRVYEYGEDYEYEYEIGPYVD